LDFFGGFGIGNIYQLSVSQVSEFDPNTNLASFSYIETEESRLAPRIHIGMKIGVIF